MTTMPTTGRSGHGTNQDRLRRHNLGTMLRHVHRDGQLSRAALTSRMGLTRSTIGDLVSELEGLGAVAVMPDTASRGSAGRPSPVVRPAPGSC